MLKRGRQIARRLSPTLPIATLILGFTAVPTEARLPRRADFVQLVRLDLSVANLPDIVGNVVGYVPLGAVLARQGLWRATGAAALISLLAEAIQLFAAGRSASLLDVALNVFGAALGCALAQRRSIALDAIVVGRSAAGIALVLAVACTGLGAFVTPRELEHQISAMILAPPWLRANPRGATAPGTLEAHWTFDEDGPGIASDHSGRGLHAALVNGPATAPGVLGTAIHLNGVDQWLDAGSPAALRLAGSVSITAWINSSTFPPDDAAIVSKHGGLGYQLDTTVDGGSRTISFKLADASGRPMFRYGATPLEPHRWYHLAGVYDAGARTIDVYLDGRLDNGRLCGRVTGRQRVSAFHTFLGRRGDQRGFEFAGDVDDVRIYSRALDESEIAEVAAAPAGRARPSAGQVDRSQAESATQVDPCGPAEPTDARLCGLIVAVGLLTGVAVMGLWPTTGWRAAALMLSFAVGFLLWPAVSPVLPAPYASLVPLLTLAGGVSVVTSARSGQRTRS
jgi:VanZ family protein